MWQLSFPDFSLVDRPMPLLFGDGERNSVGSSSEALNGQSNDIELGYVDSSKVGDERLRKSQYSGQPDEDEQDKDVACRRDGPSELSEKNPSAILLQIKIANQRDKATATAQMRRHQLHPTSVSTVSSVPVAGTPFTSRASTLMDGANEIGTGLQPSSNVDGANYDLPPKRYLRFFRHIRYTWFTVYRRLNALCLLANVICMVVLRIQNRLLKLSLSDIATASTINFSLSIVLRFEWVVNLLFMIAGRCPRWMPLRIRRSCAKIYHLGGVHSGAAMSGSLWFVIFNIAMFEQGEHVFSNHNRWIATWSLIGLVDFILATVVTTALPIFRAQPELHNWFEWVHRFGGWTAIGAFWALLVILCKEAEATTDHRRFRAIIGTHPILYMLIAITFCLIAPWVNLRRVPVISERLSDHAIRLRFSYQKNVPFCSAPRITDNPLKEWHAFASIPNKNGTGFSLLVSKAGDWTERIINNPPSHLYKRGWLTRGVMNVAPIFKSIVIVATGSGIGPVLSLLKGVPQNRTTLRLIWSTKDPFKYYDQSVLDDIFEADPKVDLLISNHTLPRPNLALHAYQLYKQINAEAVFVIANKKTTQKIVYGLESRGVPTFAPVFDS